MMSAWVNICPYTSTLLSHHRNLRFWQPWFFNSNIKGHGVPTWTSSWSFPMALGRFVSGRSAGIF